MSEITRNVKTPDTDKTDAFLQKTWLMDG